MRNSLTRRECNSPWLLARNPDITHPPGFPCKKAQTFPGLMALCPELKPVYHGVLLRQYGEGLWEITP